MSKIADSLGITPMTPTIPEPVKSIADQGDSANLRLDYRKARDNYHTLMETGMGALQHLSQVAGESKSPTMFASLASLLSTVAKINSDLLDLTEKRALLDAKLSQNSNGEGESPKGLTTQEVLRRLRD